MKAIIIENLQKSLFGENEKSLLHKLNNLRVILPLFFQGKEEVHFGRDAQS